MKKLALLAFLLSVLQLCAQNVTLSFTGVTDSGRYYRPGTIHVSNITQGWEQEMSYPDTVLFLNNTEGIVEASNALDIHLGPNPSSGHTYFSYSTVAEGNNVLRVIDIYGHLVASSQRVLSSGQHQFRIDLSRPGVFILHLSTPSGSKALKLINTTSGGVDAVKLSHESIASKASGAGNFSLGDMMELYATGWMDGDSIVSDTLMFYPTHSDTITFLFHEPPMEYPEGAIKGVFSIDSNRQVYFSIGNLQYLASEDIWRFALNQYDYLGYQNSHMGEYDTNWMDSFAWGTSGFHDITDSNNINYHPWDNDQSSVVDATYNRWGYGPSTNMPYPDLTDKSEDYDWGVQNAISNGGNRKHLWRLLTKAEFEYLLFERPSHEDLMGGARIYVDGSYINGWILLPDNWVAPMGLVFVPGQRGYTSANTFTPSQLAQMQQAGAVFLPAAGSTGSGGSRCYDLNTKATYMTSTHYDQEKAWGLFFSINEETEMRYVTRKYGRSVRLVQDVR